jgi:hypothetical protein
VLLNNGLFKKGAHAFETMGTIGQESAMAIANWVVTWTKAEVAGQEW